MFANTGGVVTIILLPRMKRIGLLIMGILLTGDYKSHNPVSLSYNLPLVKQLQKFKPCLCKPIALDQ